MPYFHVVFTLPPEAAALALHNKAVVYAILMRTAAETLSTIAGDPRHLGAEIGITAVLHTWGQTLQHHPHVHCGVSGGGPSLDGARWIACRKGFFLPVRVAFIAFVTTASWPTAPAPSASPDVAGRWMCPSPLSERRARTRTMPTSSPGVTSPSVPCTAAPCSASPVCRARRARRCDTS